MVTSGIIGSRPGLNWIEKIGDYLSSISGELLSYLLGESELTCTLAIELSNLLGEIGYEIGAEDILIQEYMYVRDFIDSHGCYLLSIKILDGEKVAHIISYFGYYEEGDMDFTTLLVDKICDRLDIKSVEYKVENITRITNYPYQQYNSVTFFCNKTKQNKYVKF